MFQVEADKKYTWAGIALGLLKLSAAWVGFFAWRFATVAAECFTLSVLKRLLPAKRHRRSR